MSDSITTNNNQDEIDLLELVKLLWQKKITILIVTLLISAIGIASSYFMQEKWTSNARITTTKVTHTELQRLINNYRLIVEDPTITDRIANEQLFQDFLQQFSSLDNKVFFLSEKVDLTAINPYFSKLSQEEKDRFIYTIAEDFVITPSKKDSYIDYYTLSFSSNSGFLSKKILTEYINFIIKLNNEKINHEINNEIALKRESTKFKYEIDKNEVLANQQIKTQTLADNLAIAKAAKVTNIIDKPINVPTTSLSEIYLGSDALAESLSIELNKDPLEIDPSLKRTLRQIQELDKINVPYLSVTQFDYLNKPVAPIKRDAPKRALIAALSFMLGLMLSVGWVLVAHSLRKVK